MFAAIGREEAGAVHRLLAHEHRRQHRRVAVLHGGVEREAVQRHRDERGVAEEVAEARAGEPRGALHVEAADLGVLRRLGARARRRGAARPRPRRCRRRERSRREGSAPARAAASRASSAAASSCSAACSCLLHAAHLLELLRRRLALELRLRAQLVDARHEHAPALVGGEPARRTPRRRPCARARRRNSSGALRAARASITRRESRYASSSAATPSSCDRRARRGRRARARRDARSRRRRRSRPTRAARGRSRRRRTRPSRSRVNPSRSATNARPLPLLTSGCANSRKNGSDFEMKRRPAKRGFSSASSAVSASGSPTATSFVGGTREPRRAGRRRRGRGMCWNSEYRLRLRR